MTAPAPPPANDGNQRPAPRIVVLLGQPGAAPTLDDEVDHLIPLSIERSAGGARIDTIVLEYDLYKKNERLVDVTAPIGFDREVEVVELDENGEILRTLAWGKIGVQPIEIVGGTSGNESIQFKIRLDHHLFGDLILETQYWDQDAGAVVELDHEWIFNPEIDEKHEPNRSSSKKDDPDYDEAWLFIDPESVRTTGAESYQGQQAASWTIAQAAHRLIWTANADEDHIKNPTLAEIEADLGTVPDDLFKNHKIKAGQYLPKALDELLEPYGCGWFISYEIDESGPQPDRIRKIRFFKDGVGAARKLYMQRPDERLEVPKTNVEQLKVDFSIVDLANEIEGRSSFKEFETTFAIFPLWSPSDDSLDIEDLKVGTETYKNHVHVGRKFGINTDGSYDNLRPEIPPASDIIQDLKDILGDDCIARRHILKPCLSRVKNEDDLYESHGVYVEWRNPENIDPGDDESGWEELSGIQISGKEAAVFVGDDKPHEGIWGVIQDDPSKLEMRVTATFTSDMRYYATATRQPTSPNGDVICLFLDLSDKFHYRTVDFDSIFFGDGTADTWTNAETEMQDYLEHLRSIDDSAEVAVSATLEGLDQTEYEIGHLITEVEGRNLKFNANAPSGGTPRQLQIVAILLDLQGQRTTLELETIQDLK